MRFFLVVIVWIVIVGGLWSYISYRDGKRLQYTAQAPVDLSVEGRFSIEITPTFSTEKDPFALTTADSSDAPLEIKLNGRALAIDAQEVQRGQTIRLENVTGMLAGHNEIFVYASPPLAESNLEHGVRLKVYEDTTVVVDETVWASEGALVSGTVSFSHLQKEGDQHDR
jgi:hypothetical protein